METQSKPQNTQNAQKTQDTQNVEHDNRANSRSGLRNQKVYAAPHRPNRRERRRAIRAAQATFPRNTEPNIGQKPFSEEEPEVKESKTVSQHHPASSKTEEAPMVTIPMDAPADQFIPGEDVPVLPRFHLEQFTYPDEVIKIQAYNQIDPLTFVGPLMQTTYGRTPTPLIAFSKFISPFNKTGYCRSLLFVGNCVKSTWNAKSEFTNIADFNNGSHIFSIRRFGYIPRTPNPTFSQIADVWLSSTYVSLCYGIKAEMMLAAYWRFKDDPRFSRLVCSIITYAVQQYEKHPGSEAAKKFRYIFELSIAFNFFVQINDELIVGLPEASTFRQTMKYNEWQEFGTFQLYNDVDPSDPRWYLQLVPRTQTEVEYDGSTLFYIPYHSRVIEQSTYCARKAVEHAMSAPGLREFLTSLTFMTNYMHLHRIPNSAAPIKPAYPEYDDEEQARKEVVDVVSFPEDFNMKVKFCLKVKSEDGKYKATILDKDIPISTEKTDKKGKTDDTKEDNVEDATDE